MTIRIIFSILLAVGILTGEAQAQLFLEDGKKVLAVSGGDHLTGSLLIHNTSSDPAGIKVYWEDFEYKSPYDGTKNFLPAGTAPGSASQWVTFSPQVFTMPGFGQQKIDYTVAVPSGIQEGHYGVLFFEKSTDATLSNEKAITLVTRVGCLFFIEPKNRSKKAVIQDVGLKTNSLTANFVNQGNVILIPNTTYYIMQGSGLVLLRGEINKLYVPSGASAPMEIPLKEPLKPGQYTLVVNSDLGDGDVVVKEIGLAVDASGQATIVNTQD
jgi:hypothetical protein